MLAFTVAAQLHRKLLGRLHDVILSETVPFKKKFPASEQDAGNFLATRKTAMRPTAGYVDQCLQHVKIIFCFYGLCLVGFIHVLL